MVTAAMKIKDACSLQGKLWQTYSVFKSRDITLLAKVRLVKAMVFPVVMYRCESWIMKKAEHQRIDVFQIVVPEKTLESPLDYKEIKLANSKGNQPWIFTGKTDAEAEAPILWPLDAKSRLEKTLMMGKIEGKSRRRMRWLDGITDSMNMKVTKSWARLSD